MAKSSKKKRSAWVDLAIAGLISSMLPAAAAWQSREYSHQEAVTREANDRTYKLEALRVERDRLREEGCAAAARYLTDETPNPALTPQEVRSTALVMQRRADQCLLPAPSFMPPGVPVRDQSTETVK
jgi:hypothetical protein